MPRRLGVGPERRRIEVAIVQRDGQRVVAQRGRVIDQILGAMADAIGRILIRVGVELDLQHAGDRPWPSRGYRDAAGAGGRGIFASRVAACQANDANTIAACRRSASRTRSGVSMLV